MLTIADNDGGLTLSASPTTVVRGGTVTATWSGIANATATDWIGLYTPGAANTAYIDWIYVSCSKTAGAARASGSCPFVVPSTVAPGTYQLRLLPNGGSHCSLLRVMTLRSNDGAPPERAIRGSMAVVRKDPAEQQPQAVSAKVSVLWRPSFGKCSEGPR